MKILTVDFETYYDRNYSLSKLTTEEYIRHNDFEVIGVSVKENHNKTAWFSGSQRETRDWLLQFDWDDAVFVAHNAAFDAAILNWHFGIRPKKIADTLSMARAIDGPDAGNSLAAIAERYDLGRKGNEVVNAMGKRRIDFTNQELAAYGRYCINDVDLTYGLFCLQIAQMPVSELDLIDLTIRMFSEPVLQLDRPLLERHLTDVRNKKQALLDKAMVDKSDLMSNPRFAELLKLLGVDPPMKVSPTTGKETYAFAKTDEGFKALLDHDNAVVQILASARLGSKSTLEETRTERFIGIAERGTLPVPLSYYAAHTGRMGGADKLNLQNLPRGSNLKKAIVAPEGYEVWDFDASQIECRVLAWMAGQEDLVDTFRNNDAEVAAGVPKAEREFDPYKIMASMIYGKPIRDITDDERQVGKVTLLACGFGMSWRKFIAYAKAMSIAVDEAFAQRIIATYREAYPYIPRIWKVGDRAIKAMCAGVEVQLGKPDVLVVGDKTIMLPNRMKLQYRNLRRTKNENGYDSYIYDTKKGKAFIPKHIWGGALAENWTQALARIATMQSLVEISKRYKVALTVHDSGVAVIPTKHREEAKLFIESAMRAPPSWAPDLPLNCEVKHGRSYGG